MNEDTPSELNTLSTHTSIDVIEIDDLTSIEIVDSAITIDGYATISVELQYGSDSDMRRGDGGQYADSFPMSFSVKLEYDENYAVESIEYKIDTSSFYE